MFKRILIASASAGNGHVKAAEAVERGIRKLYGDDVEVVNIDVFDRKYSARAVKPVYGDGYIKLANRAPDALGIAYDRTDRPWGKHGRKIGFSKLKKFIVEYQPDLVVSTHFIPGEVVSHLLCQGKINAASAIVVTDFDCHGMWFSRHYDLYFVALPETKEYMQSNGIDESRIKVTGIPINPVFAQKKERSKMRAALGLDQDRPTVLLSAGGFGVGPMQQILEALQKIKNPIQVVALCGKNEELKTQIEALAATVPASLKLLPIGYTNKMDEYMSAADIVLGKPGGLTTSEALAKQLAFVIFNPIPGQEERNSDHLLEEGAAIRCNELTTLAFKLDQLLADEARLRSMQANSARLGRPNSSQDIVRTLMSLPPRHQGKPCGTRSRCHFAKSA